MPCHPDYTFFDWSSPVGLQLKVHLPEITFEESVISHCWDLLAFMERMNAGARIRRKVCHVAFSSLPVPLQIDEMDCESDRHDRKVHASATIVSRSCEVCLATKSWEEARIPGISSSVIYITSEMSL